MTRAIEEGIARFGQLAVEKKCRPELLSLIIAFTDLAQEDWYLVDDGHRVCKTRAVENGLMLGQFHPLCAAPAAHNAEFL